MASELLLTAELPYSTCNSTSFLNSMGPPRAVLCRGYAVGPGQEAGREDEAECSAGTCLGCQVFLGFLFLFQNRKKIGKPCKDSALHYLACDYRQE